MTTARLALSFRDIGFLIPVALYALYMAGSASFVFSRLTLGGWILAGFAVIGFAAAGIFRLQIASNGNVPTPGLAIALLAASDLIQRPMFVIGLYTIGLFLSYLYLVRRPLIALYASGLGAIGATSYVLILRAFDTNHPELYAFALAAAGYLVTILALEFLRNGGRWGAGAAAGVSLGSISWLKLGWAWLLLASLAALLNLVKLELASTEFSDSQPVVTVFIIMSTALVLMTLAIREHMAHLARRLDSLVDASLALPWEQKGPVSGLVQGFAKSAANGASTEIRNEPPGYSEIGARISLTADREHYLVVKRALSAPAFAEGDQRAVDALAHIGSEAARAKEDTEGLRRQANTDSLTGLPNYGAFQEVLRTINDNRGYGEAIAVLFIDLDSFKALNDRNGHAAGDFALKGIAHRLVDTVRPHDVVARVGGDEFVVILTGLSGLGQAKTIAERIVENCARPLALDELVITPSISVGVAYSAHRETDLSRLVEDADRTMLSLKKARKQSGSSSVGNVSISAHRSSQVNDSVVRAIEHDELTVYFQPIVSIVEERIWAFEALVRYTDPDLGPISPASLVEKAKRLGLMNELTIQVITKALIEARGFAAVDASVNCITVNVEAKQILPEQLGGFLETLPARFPEVTLCLELNERSLSVVSEELHAQAEYLRDLGIMIALDDYGSENSSVGALVRMPMDILKIDRSLIDDLTNVRQLEVLRALQGFGDTLDYALVVEGVERAESALLLQSVGVRSAQGFYYGVPASAEKIRARLLEFGNAAVVSSSTPREQPVAAHGPTEPATD